MSATTGGSRRADWQAIGRRSARWLRRHALGLVDALTTAAMLGITGASAAILRYQPPHRRYIPPAPTAPAVGMTSPTCGTPSTPACPTPPPCWIPLAADTPQAVLAAARQSSLFTVDRSGGGDYADLSLLGTPQLVKEYRVAGWYETTEPLSQFYAIPILDSSGNTVEVAQALLNPQHTAIHVEAIVGIAPIPHGVVNPVSRDAAIADVQAQHHTGLRQGSAAQLIYIPSDPAIIYRPTIPLSAGASPANPVWLVPGADGKDHIVGADGHVFYVAELEAMAHR